MSDKKDDKNKLTEAVEDARVLYRKKKAGIFLEAAIDEIVSSSGVKEARKRLKYYIDVLEEFQ